MEQILRRIFFGSLFILLIIFGTIFLMGPVILVTTYNNNNFFWGYLPVGLGIIYTLGSLIE